MRAGGGIPHGPHPGTAGRSIGKTDTRGLAVLVDTFYPLHLPRAARAVANDRYATS